MIIRELEELLKSSPNKDLPVIAKTTDGDKYEITSAVLEDKELIIQEGEEVPIENDDEDEEE